MPVATIVELSTRRLHRVPPSTPWDSRVRSWEEVTSSPLFARLAERLLELAAIDSGDVVVDLGAGTGLLTLLAAQQAAAVYAVDYSEAMLERIEARTRTADLDNVECLLADLREVPLDDASADVVVSSYAFHHLPDEGKELALAEARRVLRPGGRLVICDMMFALSFRGPDRRILASKIAAIARRGPAGFVRLARNAGRVATGRWEHPATVERWRDLLEARRFTGIDLFMVENEAGIATCWRPEAIA